MPKGNGMYCETYVNDDLHFIVQIRMVPLDVSQHEGEQQNCEVTFKLKSFAFD